MRCRTLIETIPLWRVALWCGLAVVVWCGLGSGTARGQSVWELTPYRVQLQVAFSYSPEWTAWRRRELTERLVSRIDSLIGATWSVEVVEAEASWRSTMLRDLASIEMDDLPAVEGEEFDKIILMTAQASGPSLRLTAREFDVRTQRWGTMESVAVAHAARLRSAATHLVISVFSPLAMVDEVEGDQVALRLRAGTLPPRDDTLQWVTAGDLFEPFVRYTDRDGSLRRIVAVDWTYLRVESADGADVATRVYSGMRSPLSARRRGRTEQLAVVVHPPRTETTLFLHSRTDQERPLAGYDVFAYGPENKATDLLGRTNRDGAIHIEPTEDNLRLVVVRSGNQFLARLPIVPGLRPELNALLPDDTERLEAEGFITGLQESLVDLVVRREVLLALIRHYLSENRLEDATRLNEELNGLRTRQQFANELDREQQRTVSSDPSTQRKIDKLFADTKVLLNQFMRAGPVEEVQAELRAAQARAGDARASAVSPEPSDANATSATQ